MNVEISRYFEMPGFSLLTRLYKKKTSTFADDGSSTTTRVTPDPKSSQPNIPLSRTIFSTPLERRIHPNLNALAAELSYDLDAARHSTEASPAVLRTVPPQNEGSTSQVSNPPRTQNQHISSSAIPDTNQNTNTATRKQETRTEDDPEPISLDNPISSSSQSRFSPTPSNERSESRANHIFNRITGLGVRASPTPNPPSAWNTFGRRKSRRHNSIPHASDFGASPDVSLSNSQRSHASSSQTSPWHAADTSADTSGSLSMSLQSISQSHSRSQSQSYSFHTPSHTQHPHSPPSSAFTFGLASPVHDQMPSPNVPTYPALRLSLFGAQGEVSLSPSNVDEGEESHGETDANSNSFSLQPRTSVSMPSLSQHRTFDLISCESNHSMATSTRPRVQDIFPASSLIVVPGPACYQGSYKKGSQNLRYAKHPEQ
ncbi:hypothetical protein C8R42DRAFT_163628 [Lentinula raphanica]|nr:hypothetical protein C8R42DRAFT_163628 [Lentinula raphanica]